MPSVPEFQYRSGFIGRIEIDRKNDIEQRRNPRSHIAVTAEIKIELQCIGNNNEQYVHGCQNFHTAKAKCYHIAQCVCNNHFFKQTHCKKMQSLCQVFCIRPVLCFISKLRDQLSMENNRPRYELWKKRYKNCII